MLPVYRVVEERINQLNANNGSHIVLKQVKCNLTWFFMHAICTSGNYKYMYCTYILMYVQYVHMYSVCVCVGGGGGGGGGVHMVHIQWNLDYLN